MPFTTRPAAAADLSEVYNFICQLEEIIFDFPLFASFYTENIADKNKLYRVAASAEGNIIGFISCHMQNLLHHCGKVAEIQELYVPDAWRSLGIGQQLVQEISEEAKRQGCLLIEVTAQIKRTATHHFYEKSGFEHTHKKFVQQF